MRPHRIHSLGLWVPRPPGGRDLQHRARCGLLVLLHLRHWNSDEGIISHIAQHLCEPSRLARVIIRRQGRALGGGAAIQLHIRAWQILFGPASEGCRLGQGLGVEQCHLQRWQGPRLANESDPLAIVCRQVAHMGSRNKWGVGWSAPPPATSRAGLIYLAAGAAAAAHTI